MNYRFICVQVQGPSVHGYNIIGSVQLDSIFELQTKKESDSTIAKHGLYDPVYRNFGHRNLRTYQDHYSWIQFLNSKQKNDSESMIATYGLYAPVYGNFGRRNLRILYRNWQFYHGNMVYILVSMVSMIATHGFYARNILGFRVQGPRFQGPGFRRRSLGFRVQDLRFGVLGFGGLYD